MNHLPIAILNEIRDIVRMDIAAILSLNKEVASATICLWTNYKERVNPQRLITTYINLILCMYYRSSIQSSVSAFAILHSRMNQSVSIPTSDIVRPGSGALT